MQTQAIAAPLLPRLLIPVEEGFYGLPYGVAGLCESWQTQNFKGSRRRPKATYRATLVVSTYFGDFRV